MENLRNALIDETGTEVKESSVKKCFLKVYSYLLYQDTASFIETLDYRKSLSREERKRERYFIFRYMLRLIKRKHPQQCECICPKLN
ncbi:hypothetical protein K3G39_01065 [Pontibacter sp. HSC-14F20]|uniref:hypothetical protein n=1 Tax=Pontibacter sp. HSC-14F20 TaxID=2864136 RepID=UPI001C730C77|nr:hypothetical protein [Pontibacter sp. HSC-14F20]MBX0331819.1 hypothetical protein [Pontibacter sp. HSC-14F20]